MQKDAKFEEFRSYRTSKRRKKKRKERSDQRENVKTQNCFYMCDKISSEKPSNQVVIENRKKTFS